MLKIEDFSEFGVREILLSFEEFTKEGKDIEINLNFCAKDLEEHRFNSLKKAIKWWNKYFEEEE